MVDGVDGFVTGQRYRLSEAPMEAAQFAGWRYLALYDLAIDDVNAAFASHQRVREAGARTPSNGVVDPVHTGYVYTPVGEAAERDGWTGRALASHIRLVRCNAAPGSDVEFEQWHDRHARAVIDEVPDCMAARCYRLHASQRPDEPPSRREYLLLYELLASGSSQVRGRTNGSSQRSLVALSDGAIGDDYTDELMAPM